MLIRSQWQPFDYLLSVCVFRGVSCYFQTLHATLIYLKDSNALNAVFTIKSKGVRKMFFLNISVNVLIDTGLFRYIMAVLLSDNLLMEVFLFQLYGWFVFDKSKQKHH